MEIVYNNKKREKRKIGLMKFKAKPRRVKLKVKLIKSNSVKVPHKVKDAAYKLINGIS